MESRAVPEIEPAERFVKLLRQASQQDYSEKYCGKLYAIAIKHPNALPLIEERLSELTSDPNYSAMADFLNASGLGDRSMMRKYFSAVTSDSGTDFSRALHAADQYFQAGIEARYVSSLMRAMNQANSMHDQWVVMKRSIFYFNKVGHHSRAQTCALEAYQIAQHLEDESLLQRSRFSVLNSTRLKGDVNVNAQYVHQYISFTQGALFYSELDQCLIPTYAALHLMDWNQEDKMIQTFLGASNECVLDDFARLNNKVAWARYNQLRGRVHQAKTQVCELVEELSLPVDDRSVVNSLLVLSREFGVATPIPEIPVMTLSRKKLWHEFDLALDCLGESINESRRRKEGLQQYRRRKHTNRPLSY